MNKRGESWIVKWKKVNSLNSKFTVLESTFNTEELSKWLIERLLADPQNVVIKVCKLTRDPSNGDRMEIKTIR